MTPTLDYAALFPAEEPPPLAPTGLYEGFQRMPTGPKPPPRTHRLDGYCIRCTPRRHAADRRKAQVRSGLCVRCEQDAAREARR